MTIPAWEPTRKQWRCWIVAHLSFFCWFMIGFAIEEAFLGELTRSGRWPLGQVLQVVNFGVWWTLAFALSLGPMIADHRLQVGWRVFGCLILVGTMSFALLISVVVAGFVALANGGLAGVQ